MTHKFNSIFVVDDDPFHKEVMKELLVFESAKSVSFFDDSQPCLDQIDQNPDIIFLDHDMGITNGLDTLKQIKDFYPNIFIIMVSGQENIDTAAATLKYGAFDYIKKDDRLVQNVSNVLNSIYEVQELLKPRKVPI